MPQSLLLCWSGGKDSMMCLRRLQARRIRVRCLVTTVNEDDGLVSGQGVPEGLVREQADALGLPLEIVRMPEFPPNEVYKERLGARLSGLSRELGVSRVAFGDLFLDDIRRWREAFLAEYGLEARFPLWNADTGALMEEFLGLGFQAWITLVDTARLPADFAGRALDAASVAEMGPSCDPCGENGEYHSFVWDGPGFRKPVECRPAGRVRRGPMTVCRFGAGTDS